MVEVQLKVVLAPWLTEQGPSWATPLVEVHFKSAVGLGARLTLTVTVQLAGLTPETAGDGVAVKVMMNWPAEVLPVVETVATLTAPGV